MCDTTDAIMQSATPSSTKSTPVNIATISSGFEKGDFLVREEKGQRVYFDFLEEAFNYVANKGYSKLPKDEEEEWFEIFSNAHASVKEGMRYNTGTLIMVLTKPVEIASMYVDDKDSKFVSKDENTLV